ncbi:hypothetical protein BDQ12DRAFT_719096 [Crucibulum laeve]|uniref:Arrestin-like N-terminal domain-containing protein n=1 Tax=Crucibulum laeve TaxID=68775 RepID=A0A5C3MEZ2_9AGAR|nr:hypothetical protein BDQ12DRAFT_719096 [Crucibulum laeve]
MKSALPRYSTLEPLLPSPSTLSTPSSAESSDSSTQRYSAQLPRYSAILNSPPPAGQRRVPRAQQQTEHTFRLSKTEGKSNYSGNASGKPWATMTVLSTSLAKHKVPRFFGGDQIAGFVELELEAPLAVQSVSISLRGKIITSPLVDGAHQFLDHSFIVWSKTQGDPRTVLSSSSSTNSNTNSKKFDGKLQGSYSWTFSFPFPTQVTVPARGERSVESYPSPQTVQERDISARVEYELTLRIAHGMFKADSKVQTNVLYIPKILPDLLPLLRQHAYREGKPLIGPHEDVGGWTTLPKVSVRGALNRKPVLLDCVLSLGGPTCYTRGTVIPCYITISSTNPEALDRLASPDTINARLVRHVKFYKDSKKLLGVTEEVAEIQTAVWWIPSDLSIQETGRRCLEGEIHLDKDLQPSCDLVLFRIEYFVELLPFKSLLIETNASKKESVLLSYPIEIGTFHADGPTPKPFTKPLKKITSSKHRGSPNSQWPLAADARLAGLL